MLVLLVLPQVGTHCDRSKYRATDSYVQQGNRHGHQQGTPCVVGAVGLRNLGNTCFFSSILQCLSNIKPLTKHFTSGDFLPELNTTNKLGMGGRLAEAYADLLKDMWSGDYTCCTPDTMRRCIGEYAPQVRCKPFAYALSACAMGTGKAPAVLVVLPAHTGLLCIDTLCLV